MYPQLVVLDLVLVFVKSAWRWPGSMRTVFVESTTVTRTHEQVRFLKPAHRASEMSAIDRKDLKLVAFYPPHPARNVRSLTIPFARVGITKFRYARLVLWECCQRSKCNP